jgi:hypothetical protein
VIFPANDGFQFASDLKQSKFLIDHQKQIPLPVVLIVCALAGILAFIFLYKDDTIPNIEMPSTGVSKPAEAIGKDNTRVSKTNFSEDLILNLTPRLKLIANQFQGGNPGDFGEVFQPSVGYRGPSMIQFDGSSVIQSADPGGLAARYNWPIETSSKTTSTPATDIWAEILTTFELVDGKFGVLSGKVLESGDQFEMKTSFEARFNESTKNHAGGIKTKQTLTWKNVGENEWRIEDWKQEKVEVVVSQRSLFTNVTESAITDPKLLELVQRSEHEEFMLERAKNSDIMQELSPKGNFFADWNSLYSFPSTSVIDLDQDGWDDLYLTSRKGKNLVLRNRGDQTFEDVTESTGLGLNAASTNCALFADFDNDGDSDVLLGRGVEPSLFYENRNGKFVQDQAVNQQLTRARFVSSGAVVDINRDGLLDVYLSTYVSATRKDLSWIQYVVPPELQEEMSKRHLSDHPFVDRTGPPNLVLMNRNGKLELVEPNAAAAQWRNSFQSVWTDVDQDGDLDMYLCNDFAPDVFLSNETKQGSFSVFFRDRTGEFIPGNTMGFGMGASLGDYDSDGRTDIYVSNMYSKAGHRVIGNFDGEVDPRIKISSQGNFLFRGDKDGFQQVAGLDEGKQQVSKVGWSFGGQMADFNNDQKLDVYVPSGFFTAPDPIAKEVDL